MDEATNPTKPKTEEPPQNLSVPSSSRKFLILTVDTSVCVDPNSDPGESNVPFTGLDTVEVNGNDHLTLLSIYGVALLSPPKFLLGLSVGHESEDNHEFPNVNNKNKDVELHTILRIVSK